MTDESAFSLDPWALREIGLGTPGRIAQSESLFALANGHVGWRGVLDEGEPHGQPGTYLNGVYELRPLPYAESSYGRPESGQTVINVTNGKLIRLFVEDEPLDLRYGSLVSHERELDFRTGLLTRQTEWVSPAGKAVSVTSRRLVSFVHRAVAAVQYEVEAVGQRVHVAVQSELLANEQLPPADGDPRRSAVLEHPLVAEHADEDGNAVVLVHATRHSKLRVGVAMDHLIECQAAVRTDTRVRPYSGMVTASATLEPGQRLQMVKFVAHGWSGERSLEAVRDQVWAALSAGQHQGWDALVASQRDYLDEFWDRADVEVEGDVEIQQAVRFALFHLLQAGARGQDRPIPAKGLTGPGYDGHAFWDTEMFVLPVLTMTAPDAAASALRWRHSTLPAAVQRARQLGFDGAAFPWRTIAGQECSGYWPAGTAAFHVNADIADAVVRYVDTTLDEEFARGPGMELLVQTARLWRSLGHHNADGSFHIDGVTGPDEYSAIADDNVYTNLMAQRNLFSAAVAAETFPERARDLNVDIEEAASWRDAANAMYIPYDEVLQVHPQADRFTAHQVWDFDATPADHYPLMLHYHYLDLYRKQVVKQADLVLAMQTCSDSFTPEQKSKNFEYYEPLTVRDSSLSACTQAIIAAEVGHLDLAYEYLGEAAFIDLRDLDHNTRDGNHIASLAGTYLVMVAGFGGLRLQGHKVRFSPRLPNDVSRLAFTVMIHGLRLRVEINHDEATYLLIDGDKLEISHHGTAFTLAAGEPSTHSVPPTPQLTRPRQPAHRAPTPRQGTKTVPRHTEVTGKARPGRRAG